SLAPSTFTSGGCASASSGMTPTPSSSSRSAASATSSTPTRSTHRLAAELFVPTLAALTAGAAVALPYELAGGRHGLALAGVAALAVALGATWTMARRWEGRLGRILRFAEQLETGASMPFLAAERRDLVGEVED